MPGAFYFWLSLMTSTEIPERQRRHWMRPDARNFIRPDWRNFVKPGFENEFLRPYGLKYSPDQPRVPAGNPDGGQWTSEEGSTDVNAILGRARQLAATRRSNKYLECLDLCSPILERWQTPGADFNQWDFHRCMNECLGDNR